MEGESLGGGTFPVVIGCDILKNHVSLLLIL